jgi:hypothetical protein
MSCRNVQELISSLLLDRKLPDAERENVLAHIECCRACCSHLEAMQAMRAALRSMGQPAIPPVLSAKLRVLASHERARRFAERNLSARLRHWYAFVRLAFDNMMRPLAVPFTGGILSAVLVFSLLVPVLSFPHNYADDPSTIDFTFPDGQVIGATDHTLGPDEPETRLEPVSAIILPGEKAVDLVIDDTGQVRDYSVIRGDLTPDMVNVILLSRFTPATYSGQPTWGTIRVVFPRHRRGVRS